jgi:hypothetical protein
MLPNALPMMLKLASHVQPRTEEGSAHDLRRSVSDTAVLAYYNLLRM